jgi:hypothetical protein
MVAEGQWPAVIVPARRLQWSPDREVARNANSFLNSALYATGDQPGRLLPARLAAYLGGPMEELGLVSALTSQKDPARLDEALNRLSRLRNSNLTEAEAAQWYWASFDFLTVAEAAPVEERRYLFDPIRAFGLVYAMLEAFKSDQQPTASLKNIAASLWRTYPQELSSLIDSVNAPHAKLTAPQAWLVYKAMSMSPTPAKREDARQYFNRAVQLGHPEALWRNAQSIPNVDPHFRTAMEAAIAAGSVDAAEQVGVGLLYGTFQWPDAPPAENYLRMAAGQG